MMEFEWVKSLVEKKEEKYEFSVDSMPKGFIEPIVTQGLKIEHVEPGRIVCSYTVPERLLNTENSLHGGALVTLVDIVGSSVIFTAGPPVPGVSVEINISYLDSTYVGEEIEIEAKAVRIRNAIGAVSVEFKSKKTGKIIAQGRHTLIVPSKM